MMRKLLIVPAILAMAACREALLRNAPPPAPLPLSVHLSAPSAVR